MFQFASTHINPRLFSATQLDAKLFALTHINPHLFSATQIDAYTNISVTYVDIQASSMAYGTPVSCSAWLANGGAAGSRDIEWQVIAFPDNSIESSGVQTSPVIPRKGSSVELVITGVVSPSSRDTMYRIRARVADSPAWVYTAQIMINYVPGPPDNPPPRDPIPPPLG